MESEMIAIWKRILSNRDLSVYNRVRALCGNSLRKYFVFSNEHHKDTYDTDMSGESKNDRNDRAIRVAAQWYQSHLAGSAKVLLVTNDKENKRKATEEGISAQQEFHGAISDIAITTNRTRMADFTQPYIESGLVVVAPVKPTLNSNPWAFLRPFSPMMWGVTAAFFLFVGTVVWILEHKQNDEFRGPPKRQVVTILWFSFSTWFFAHTSATVDNLQLPQNPNYTASLTSILTVQKLSSSIKGLDDLLSSNDPIGYQQGSFARNYLIDELNVDESRLVPLITPDDYAKALKDGPHKGGVTAVIDERAYIELFLSSRCEFNVVGKEFTKTGWGFAFPRDSPLVVDLSTALLKLSDNGDLQRIYDKWLMRTPCASNGGQLQVDRLQLKSFRGLFIICGAACVLALAIYFCIMLRQFSKHYTEELVSTGSSTSARVQTFLTFVDEKEEEVKSRSKRRRMERLSNRSAEDEAMSNSKRRHLDQSSSRPSFDNGNPA